MRLPLVSIVDDDISVRESLPDLLRQVGYAAEAFPSAEAFLASDRVDETSCLLLDVAMPGMSGPELQEELAHRRQAIPIVYITGQGDQSLRARLVALGAVDCLFKPFSEAALLAALDAAHPDAFGMTAAVAPQPTLHWVEQPPNPIEAIRVLGAKPVVYVVDDDVSVRESLELLIKREGWQPELFASAQDFLTHARDDVPSCLVLDVSLPGLDGLELQQQLAGRSEIPIVFITGHGDVPMSVRAMKAGAVEFLTKPFGPMCWWTPFAAPSSTVAKLSSSMQGCRR